MTAILPRDWRAAVLLGRIETADGPTPVLLRDNRLLDISAFAPTTAMALARPDLAAAEGRDLGAVEDIRIATAWGDAGLALLSPLDLQCIKASGVTFAVPMSI